MDSMKNVILDLERKNLLLNAEQRQQLRAWSKDEKFLKEKGKKIVLFLTQLNEKESEIFQEIVKKDPDFLKNFKQKYSQDIREKIKVREQGQRNKELDEMNDFLEDAFSKLSE